MKPDSPELAPEVGRTAPRQLKPELLDELPANDPRAIRGRRDLRRINAWMGNAATLAQMLVQACPDSVPNSLAEIGAGDGSLMLSVAQRLHPAWKGVQLTLVDRQSLLETPVRQAFAAIGWTTHEVQSDVFTWLDQNDSVDVIVANLFLHHFDEPALRQLFERVARQARLLVACEPRRLAYPRAAGQLLRLIGCGPVARYDGTLSIAAGFVQAELSALWPVQGGWELREGKAGLFSHSFCARRVREAAIVRT